MNPHAFDQLMAVQEKHWWFIHRARLIQALLAPLFPLPGQRVLDFGCGSGSTMSLLSRYGRQVVGLEHSAHGIAMAKHCFPTGFYVRGDGNQVGALFQPASFDLIGVFGVLYHQGIHSPQQVLQQLAHLLKPGGWLILTESAFPFLHRQHDRQADGARRFWPGEMITLLQEANLHIEKSSCWNTLSFLPAALLALFDGILPESGTEIGELTLPPAWLNQAMTKLLTPEVWLIQQGWLLPLGVSMICLARKPLTPANYEPTPAATTPPPTAPVANTNRVGSATPVANQFLG